MSNFHEYFILHSLKSGGTKYHFRKVKVPGTTPYWKACMIQTVINFITKWDKDQFVCNLFHLISDYNLRTLQFCIFNRSSKNNICVFQVSFIYHKSLEIMFFFIQFSTSKGKKCIKQKMPQKVVKTCYRYRNGYWVHSFFINNVRVSGKK